MKETGMLFTPENIRLVMSGQKWQTRRVITPQPTSVEYWLHGEPSDSVHGSPCLRGDDGRGWAMCGPFTCRQGSKGDHLYIKEGVIVRGSNQTLVGYYMDGARPLPPYDKRLTAMFMAKRYARTWLELTDVRVERLQDISEEDAIAEGIKEEHVIVGSNCNGGIHHEESAMRYFYAGGEDEGYESASEAYRHLWDSINGNAHPWESNPFVWRLSFRLI